MQQFRLPDPKVNLQMQKRHYYLGIMLPPPQKIFLKIMRLKLAKNAFAIHAHSIYIYTQLHY
jgi:hypothetical protein